MNVVELCQLWQRVRNGRWQDQEAFIKLITKELIDARNLLEFFAQDKYSAHQGFKNIDGTIQEQVNKMLKGFKEEEEIL